MFFLAFANTGVINDEDYGMPGIRLAAGDMIGRGGKDVVSASAAFLSWWERVALLK